MNWYTYTVDKTKDRINVHFEVVKIRRYASEPKLSLQTPDVVALVESELNKKEKLWEIVEVGDFNNFEPNKSTATWVFELIQVPTKLEKSSVPKKKKSEKFDEK